MTCPTAYRSRDGARSAARRHHQTTGALSWIWRCPVCSSWHLGPEPPAAVLAYPTFAGRRRLPSERSR